MNIRGSRARGVRFMLVALTVGIMGMVLAGCGGGAAPPSSSSASTENNQQDAVFAEQLIELSDQLVTSATILLGKSENEASTQALTELIKTGNERKALASGWLRTWGRKNVEAPPAPGLLTEAQLEKLIVSSGAPLAAAVKDLALSQYNGTVAISKSETELGLNAQAKLFAAELLEKAAKEQQLLTEIKP